MHYALALVPVAVGLHRPDVINIEAPGLRDWKPIRTGKLGSYLAGPLSSLVILPCATPVPAAILTYAAGRGGVLLGSGLLFTYGAGLGVTIVLFGTNVGLTTRVRAVTRRWELAHRAGGVTLVGPGFNLLRRA